VCQPHIKRGEHLKLYRFSPAAYREIGAVSNGPHPETGEDLHLADESAPREHPVRPAPQQAVFAPDPEEIAQIAAKLRQSAGLPEQPTSAVAKTATAFSTRPREDQLRND
jgi:hypothetical protein